MGLSRVVWMCLIRTQDATLLVSAFRKTPKVKAVRKEGGTVVLRSFLEQCYERRQVVRASSRFHLADDLTAEVTAAEMGSRQRGVARDPP
jgi:hypothetical protein